MDLWNPEKPESWASALGLVHLPLFPVRPGSSEQDHTVLLDGERTGIAFTFGDPDRLLKERKALSWSWSSNLTHTFVLDKSNQKLHIGRWDQPDDFVSHPMPNEKRAADLLNAIATSDPPRGQTVVKKMIHLFRIIRKHITDRGGVPMDVVHAFTGVLALAGSTSPKNSTAVQSYVPYNSYTLGGSLATVGLPDFFPQKTPNIVLDFPVRELVEGLIEYDPDTNYYLDPNLLIRHAAGDLFQETRVELAQRDFYQPSLFVSVSLDATSERGRLRSDVHYTPPSLARVLVEQTVLAIRKVRQLPESLEVLDPACGSGVFLIEALRELGFGNGQGLKLKGFEESDVSCEMARFSLNQAIRDGGLGALPISYDIKTQDSLISDFFWGSPDIILMNPPFVPWRSMSELDRKQTVDTLGDLYSGQPDKALAFLWKAIRSLKPGAALGTVLPTPVLEGKWGNKLRKSVEMDPTLFISLVGRFQDYGYFEGADVKPAFLVIARNLSPRDRGPIQVVITSRETEGRAFRDLRRGMQLSSPDAQAEWEVFEAPPEDFSPASWMPRTRGTTTVIKTLSRARVPRVSDLFDVHLGIRTGLNDVFQFSASQLRDLHPDKTEREFFKPVADNDTIRDAGIKGGWYVFYPYDRDGKLMLTTEEELRLVMPQYYSRYLLPNRTKLESRKSIRDRKWWELSEPRLSWQPQGTAKIVSPCFGRSGKFAYDARGRYCVVQGFAWFWKSAPFEDHYLPLAYLAILNSRFFEGLLRLFCPQVHGGQYSLYPDHVGRVFLPDLSDHSRVPSDLTDQLKRFGSCLAKGNQPDPESLDIAVDRTYNAAILNDPLRFLLNELYPMSKEDRHDMAIDRVIGFYEDALSLGNLDLCNAALREVNVEALAPSVSLAFLSMTLVAKTELSSSRPDFFNRLRQFLLRSRSESEVRRLLKGLE